MIYIAHQKSSVSLSCVDGVSGVSGVSVEESPQSPSSIASEIEPKSLRLPALTSSRSRLNLFDFFVDDLQERSCTLPM